MISFYRRFVSVLLLSFCYSDFLNAHAVVIDHSVITDAIYAHQAKKVELTFNSRIEIELSQVFLVRRGDIEEKLIVKRGQSAGKVLIDLPALGIGEYALRYKVFAVDGHITDDIIHFTVVQP